MNILTVLIDSLNRGHLGAYGAERGTTPALDAFAERSWRFDNHFVGSLPCMPARREIIGGFKEAPWRPWGPLEPFDSSLPRVIGARGYRTAIVTDHFHYWELSGNGYLQGFEASELIRGHETDPWKPLPRADETLPAWVERIERWRPGEGRRYFANVRDFSEETDYFPARVMTAARRWLEAYADGRPFWLHVESFDVHEPFDVPEPYRSRYGSSADNDRFTIWPPYQDPEQLARFFEATTSEEVAHVRSQYEAKLAMVDRWFGELLATLDRLDLWKDTIVLVTTDHGHDLGDRQTFGKEFPHFDSHANIPLLLWHPAYPGNGRGITALTSTIDIHATLRDAACAAQDDRSPSQSLLRLIGAPGGSNRAALLYGTFGQGLCCTDGEWSLFRSARADAPLYYYSSMIVDSLTADSVHAPVDHGFFIPRVELPQWKVPISIQPRSSEDFLFCRAEDPLQQHNRIHDAAEQLHRMVDLMRGLLLAEGAPPEAYERLAIAPPPPPRPKE